MTAKRRKTPPKGQRFSSKRQPARRRKKAAPAVAKPGTFNSRAVERLAADGVEGEDISAYLKLTGRLGAEPQLRAKFDEAVATGHVAFRTAVARTLGDEAIAKRKTSPLLSVAQAWLARYQDTIMPEEEGALVARVEALLVKLREARR